MAIGIGIAIAIFGKDRDRDHDFNVGDRAHALVTTIQERFKVVENRFEITASSPTYTVHLALLTDDLIF